jgi:hypothetical protein
MSDWMLRDITFEVGGVEFIDENGGGPGVRLRDHRRSKNANNRAHFVAISKSKPIVAVANDPNGARRIDCHHRRGGYGYVGGG